MLPDRGGVRAAGSRRAAGRRLLLEPRAPGPHRRARARTAGRRKTPRSPAVVRKAKFVYLSDGSPLHLRSVLKGSVLFESLLAVYHGGGVVARRGGRDAARRPHGRPAWRRLHRRVGRGAQHRHLPVPRHRGRAPPGAVHRPAPRECDARRDRRADRAVAQGTGWKVVGVVRSVSTTVMATRSRTAAGSDVPGVDGAGLPA